MMSAPPEQPDTLGPLCKVCNKPMKSHSYKQQKSCFEEAKKRGIDIC